LAGEPLANDTAKRLVRASLIRNAKRHSFVMPKIEFSQIPLQMLLADMMVGAIDAAPQMDK
jgi:hypothetical protein